jgi:uracil-DNA glycosylase family 4
MARGEFKARPDDGLELVGTAITNAVRCVPPENKPVGAEIATCRTFLVPTIARFPNLRAVLALGSIAHQSTVRALGGRVAAYPFKHGGQQQAGAITLFSSYHCSRYNTNTGVLTQAMFVNVFGEIAEFLQK